MQAIELYTVTLWSIADEDGYKVRFLEQPTIKGVLEALHRILDAFQPSGENPTIVETLNHGHRCRLDTLILMFTAACTNGTFVNSQVFVDGQYVGRVQTELSIAFTESVPAFKHSFEGLN